MSGLPSLPSIRLHVSPLSVDSVSAPGEPCEYAGVNQADIVEGLAAVGGIEHSTDLYGSIDERVIGPRAVDREPTHASCCRRVGQVPTVGLGQFLDLWTRDPRDPAIMGDKYTGGLCARQSKGQAACRAGHPTYVGRSEALVGLAPRFAVVVRAQNALRRSGEHQSLAGDTAGDDRAGQSVPDNVPRFRRSFGDDQPIPGC